MGDLLPERTKFRPVLKLKPLTTSENDLHEKVASLLWKIVLAPAEWTCFPAGAVPLPAAAAAKLSRYGLKRGWPDILVLHQRLYGIELKTAKGRLSKGYTGRSARGGPIWREGQEEVFPRLLAAGMGIRVCRSEEEVVVALDDWGIPHRPVRLA